MNVLLLSNLLSYKDVGNGKYLKPKKWDKKNTLSPIFEAETHT